MPDTHPARQPPLLVQERRVRVARLMVSMENPSCRRIASQINVSLATAGRDMKAIREEWRERRLADYDEYIDQQFAKLAVLEEDARRSIEMSFRETTEVTDEFEVAGDGEQQAMRLSGQKRKRRPPQPNTNAMQVVLRCISERARMLGLHDGGGEKDDEAGTAFVFTTQIDNSVHLSMGNQEEVLRRALDAEQWNGRNVLLVDSSGKKRLPAEVLSGGNGDEPKVVFDKKSNGSGDDE